MPDEPIVPAPVPVALVRKGRGAVSNIAHRFESVERISEGDDALEGEELLPPLSTTLREK